MEMMLLAPSSYDYDSYDEYQVILNTSPRVWPWVEMSGWWVLGSNVQLGESAFSCLDAAWPPHRWHETCLGENIRCGRLGRDLTPVFVNQPLKICYGEYWWYIEKNNDNVFWHIAIHAYCLNYFCLLINLPHVWCQEDLTLSCFGRGIQELNCWRPLKPPCGTCLACCLSSDWERRGQNGKTTASYPFNIFWIYPSSNSGK